jgi:hypothetical protein
MVLWLPGAPSVRPGATPISSATPLYAKPSAPLGSELLEALRRGERRAT